MAIYAMDLETSRPFPTGDDWRQHRPLGIACAAIAGPEGTQIWAGEDEDGGMADQMSQDEAAELVEEIARIMVEGHTIFTWNGLGFDWQVLAEESGMRTVCEELARQHVDMMFHLFCVKGYPLALETAAEGMGAGSKTEGMDGSMAPRMWQRGEREAVANYCRDDAELTRAVAAAATRELRWTSRSGRPNNLRLTDGWLTVEKAMRLREPDTSWMDDPISRNMFQGWLIGQEPPVRKSRRQTMIPMSILGELDGDMLPHSEQMVKALYHHWETMPNCPEHDDRTGPKLFEDWVADALGEERSVENTNPLPHPKPIIEAWRHGFNTQEMRRRHRG